MSLPYLTFKEKDWAYKMWCIGYTKKQIAEALYVCEKNCLTCYWKQTENKTNFEI